MTAIIRLVLDGYGELVRGEIVGVSGEVDGRFTEWAGLLAALRRYAAESA